MHLESLTQDSFTPRLQEVFTISLPGAALELVLTEVQPLGRSLNRQAFSLTFTGPVRPILPQAIHRLENPNLGALELFLVPLGPKNGVCLYEAIFT